MFMGVTEAKRKTRGRPSEDLIVTASEYLWEGFQTKPKRYSGSLLWHGVFELLNDAHIEVLIHSPRQYHTGLTQFNLLFFAHVFPWTDYRPAGDLEYTN